MLFKVAERLHEVNLTDDMCNLLKCAAVFSMCAHVQGVDRLLICVQYDLCTLIVQDFQGLALTSIINIFQSLHTSFLYLIGPKGSIYSSYVCVHIRISLRIV